MPVSRTGHNDDCSDDYGQLALEYTYFSKGLFTTVEAFDLASMRIRLCFTLLWVIFFTIRQLTLKGLDVFGCLLLRIFCNYNVQTIELGHEVMTLKESMELSFSLGFPSIV